MDAKSRKKLDYQYKKYGITYAQYEEMALKGCHLCGKYPKKGQRRYAVDHDHKTDRTRGILCYYCNKYRLGRLNVFWARKILIYLELYE